MRRLGATLILTLMCSFGYAESYNVLDVLEFTLPSDFEVLSIAGSFLRQGPGPEYDFEVYMEIAYKSAWLPMTLDLFGNTDSTAAAATSGCRGKVQEYSSRYNMADQPKFLLPAYESNPKFTPRGLRYSRFASDWASGVSSNYVSFYFKTQSRLFSEAIVGVLNSWGAFPPVEPIDFDDQNFEAKVAKQNTDTRTYYALLQELIDSISIPPRPGLKKFDCNSVIMNYKVEDGPVVPSIDNLRLRTGPSRNAPVVGKVTQSPYRIIQVGPKETIDGIKGRWVRIAPLLGNQTGWAFDGYLRKTTEKEVQDFYEGR